MCNPVKISVELRGDVRTAFVDALLQVKEYFDKELTEKEITVSINYFAHLSEIVGEEG